MTNDVTHNNLGKRKASRSISSEREIASTSRLTLDVATAKQDPPKSNVNIQKPTPIISFSYDEKRNLHHDDRSKRYFHYPPPRADLNFGFNEWIQRDESVNEHLDSLLDSLIELKKRDTSTYDRHVKTAKLITWRGMMTKLCTILYEDRQGFEMNAMMINDTLYIEENEKKSEILDDRRKRMMYYGYSFESFTCHESKNKFGWDGNVDTNVQWCSIVKTSMDDIKIIIGGEVDAIDVNDSQTLIEVKTSMDIRNAKDEEIFEKKMLRFYMQSFLLGVMKVIVGFRDRRGFIVTCQEFQTLEMPRLVRGKKHEWNPMKCLEFSKKILQETRNFINKDDGNVSTPLPVFEKAQESSCIPVYRIKYDFITQQLIVYRLSKEKIDGVKGNSTDRIGFLTKRFYEFLYANENSS